MPSPTQLFGAEMENLAALFLEQRGYRILARQFRTRTGELDLIAEEQGVLVFCEVKARRGLGQGLPGEAIDRRKQARMLRTAQCFLLAHPKWRAHPSRFDAVLLQRQGEYWQIELVQDAFCPGWW
jgi:putative endonuclease